ncbi:hypothetical protein BGZ67_003848 [Mortierella alpina]|nr:hypothetical protein BGZ67_003848 [Mortierella alpina]
MRRGQHHQRVSILALRGRIHNNHTNTSNSSGHQPLPYRFFTSSSLHRYANQPPKSSTSSSSTPPAAGLSQEGSETAATTARTVRKRVQRAGASDSSASGPSLRKEGPMAGAGEALQSSSRANEDGKTRETHKGRSGSYSAKSGDPPSSDSIHAASTSTTLYPTQPPFVGTFQSRDVTGGGGGSGTGDSFAAAGRKTGAAEQASEWMGSIQNPRTIVKHLDEYVIGQEKAKKILAVAVYNHYSRVNENLRQQQIQESLTAISNAQSASPNPAYYGSSVLMSEGPSTPDPIIEPYNTPATTPTSPGSPSSPSSASSSSPPDSDRSAPKEASPSNGATPSSSSSSELHVPGRRK